MSRDRVAYWKSELGYCRRHGHNSNWRRFCKHSLHKSSRKQAKLSIKEVS